MIVNFDFSKQNSWAALLTQIADCGDDSLISFVKNIVENPEEIKVQSSGSTGKPKVFSFTYSQYKASAEISIRYFGLKAGMSCLLPMSLKHIGAQLMLVRAFEAKMKIEIVPARSDLSIYLNSGYDFVPMVPTQFLLSHESDSNCFRNVKTILLGGSHISKEVQQIVNSITTQVYSSYGMTETLTHVGVKDVSSKESTYEILPGFKLSLNQYNCLVIDAPHFAEKQITNDVARIQEGSFEILGRIDNVINTGGKKVQAEELEKSLANGLNQAFYISSSTDAKWGQILTLVTNAKLTEVERAFLNHYNDQSPSHLKIRKVIIDEVEFYNGKVKRKRF